MAVAPETRKRPASSHDGDQDLKRQKRHYHHVHTTKVKQDSDVPNILNDPQSVSDQLRRSISIVLQTIGFQDASADALDSFTFAAEEYMSHLLHYARTSMEAGKRVQAIPFDFEYALNANQLQLRSLLCHLNPPTSKGTKASQQLVAPPIRTKEIVVDENAQRYERFSLSMSGSQMQMKLPLAPKRLPTLPSTHTYKSTPADSTRATDAKSIRERATEESRLGEEALRRLVSTGQGKAKARVNGQTPSHAFLKCMEMLEQEAQSDMEQMDFTRTDFTGPPINAESRYWRKDIKAVKPIGGRNRDPG